MDPWCSSFIRVNGVTLHYYRTGKGRAPVVLAHGLTDSADCWRRLVHVLAPRYDVVFYDARGHGQSEAPESGYAAADLVRDLAGLIEVLALGPVRVIGHSLGALTAAWLLVEHPPLAKCAVLEDPPLGRWSEATLEDRARMEEGWRNTLQRYKMDTLEELIAQRRSTAPGWDDEDLESWAESKLRASPHAVSSVSVPRSPWQEVVRRIKVPTLLIRGDTTLGALVTPELAHEAAGVCPCLETVHLPGAGHSVRRDQFEPYCQAVLRFLARY